VARSSVSAQPTAPVVVEEYTYGAVVDLAERAGATLIGLPADAGGVQPDRLDAALRRRRPAFVILAPASQLLALRVLASYDRLLPGRREDLSRKAGVFRRHCAEHLPRWRVVTPHGGLTHCPEPVLTAATARLGGKVGPVNG
jgi:DNA-binding transcriptional MocR family regulator